MQWVSHIYHIIAINMTYILYYVGIFTIPTHVTRESKVVQEYIFMTNRSVAVVANN